MKRPFPKKLNPLPEGTRPLTAELLAEQAEAQRAHREIEQQERASHNAAVERLITREPACQTHPFWVPPGPGHFRAHELRSLCPYCAAERREAERRAREQRPEVVVQLGLNGRPASAGPVADVAWQKHRERLIEAGSPEPGSQTERAILGQIDEARVEFTDELNVTTEERRVRHEKAIAEKLGPRKRRRRAKYSPPAVKAGSAA